MKSTNTLSYGRSIARSAKAALKLLPDWQKQCRRRMSVPPGRPKATDEVSVGAASFQDRSFCLSITRDTMP